ncbi:hypothetical protein Btru_031473 [Bulinus truncatus]|nr:hypothetical protein Btru_031473 [Bulinus truncatus]
MYVMMSYHFNYNESASKRQAENHCQKNYNSYLTSPESDKELDFLLSHIFPMNSNVIETKVIFLGLNKIKGSKEFIWDSKNPFVQRVPGISQSVKTSDRDICVYLNVTSNENSTSAVSKVKVHDKYMIEWITVNCSKNIPDVNIACECHVVKPNDKRNEDHFIIHRETPSLCVLPTKNVIYALNTLFFFDQKNESRLIAPQTSADVQKFECDTKKMPRMNKLRQYVCHYENFTLNTQNYSSDYNNYNIVEMSKNTKISSYYNYLLTTKRWSETGKKLGNDITDYTNNTSDEFNNLYYIKCDNDTYAPKCIFAKYENNIQLLGCSDNLHLQDCKDFKCSTGYFKCPKSYCIPLYQVNDGVNDCPRGEDENVIFKTNSPQCTGHMILKAYDMCLETDICHQIHKDIIDGASLSISDLLLASDYRLCCEVIVGKNIPVEKCQAPSDAISTCQHLVGDTLKRVIIWIVCTITVIGNGFVLFFRIAWNLEVKTKSYILFVIGLAVSDFVMGVNLIIIASADIYFRNDYVLKESSWRNGALCHFTGFLSTVPSETYTFFICWITYDRYIKAKYTFGKKRISERLKYAAFLSSWILGFSLALIPAVYSEWEIYSSNGMCLALPLNTGHFKGWEYSFAVFVILNFALFMIIAVGQVAIFVNIIQSRKHFQFRAHGKDDNVEIPAAKKLALVAISDFLCWFPIGILGMISFNGYKYNTDVYAWVAIFILPVHSAVNPLPYTIPAIKDMQNKKR